MDIERSIERKISADQNKNLPDIIECRYEELDEILDIGSYGASGIDPPPRDMEIELHRAPNGNTFIPFPVGAERSSDRLFDPDPPIFYEDIASLAASSKTHEVKT